MPTGYTACILEGADFETFAKVCMRAFSAAAHMSDEPVSKPYEPRRPSEYYADRLKEAQAKLAELESLSPDDRLVHAVQEYEKKRASMEEYIERHIMVKERYATMLAQVAAFVPPTSDHQTFKSFMISQIRRSMPDEDISHAESALKTLIQPTTKADGEEWYCKQHAHVVQEIASFSAYVTKDLQQCEKENEWAREAIVAIEQAKQAFESGTVDWWRAIGVPGSSR